MPFFSADQLKVLLVIHGEAFKPAFQTFQHSLHQHDLTLHELSPLCNSVLCAGCESLIQGPTYCCDDCNYYLHRSCAELPLQAPFPLLHDQRHPLTLTEVQKEYLLRQQESTRALCYSSRKCY
ncbi:hypothetical protein MLD38_024339 [Melastoma candidum]|uniref:Uncharacterized protein n=1 Tax=Melastoma candidum TaxID=119954 RepID=A0ACB9NRQ3_9MYRT|nr:hypothetical protein MLD38_024339 [Melastoma candidum]